MYVRKWIGFFCVFSIFSIFVIVLVGPCLQVEVYQGDFRAEREAREALATDREKLRDELRHLQTRNTQLVDELEAYQRRHLNQGYCVE